MQRREMWWGTGDTSPHLYLQLPLNIPKDSPESSGLVQAIESDRQIWQLEV